MTYFVLYFVFYHITNIMVCIYKLNYIELCFSSYKSMDNVYLPKLQIMSSGIHSCMACDKYDSPMGRTENLRKRDYWNGSNAYSHHVSNLWCPFVNFCYAYCLDLLDYIEIFELSWFIILMSRLRGYLGVFGFLVLLYGGIILLVGYIGSCFDIRCSKLLGINPECDGKTSE